MAWFYKEYFRPSSKNGKIRIVHELWGWYVSVDGTGQSTPYLHSMWRSAFKKVKRHVHSPIKNILMLGLGAGGEIRNLNKFFPNAHITIVEFDNEMITLTKELGLYRPYPLPEIIEGDAAEVVPRLTDTYDLIMVDLFVGEAPSSFITEKPFQEAVHNRLAHNGVLLLNVYKRADFFPSVEHTFDRIDTWKYKLNNVGLFRLRE